jgi:hypothetical protein
LRELHECHERSYLSVGRASRARRPETCDARTSRSSLCTENVKARHLRNDRCWPQGEVGRWLAEVRCHG